MKVWSLTLGWALLLVHCSASAEWTAPQNPSPKQILLEAQEDARAGRYETALQKHIWYHRNALKYDEAQRGVRLGTVLHDWQDLGKNFPPAKAEFDSEHARARARLDAASDDADAIREWAAFNRVIGDTASSAGFFIRLDAEKPELAARVYRNFESSLLVQRQYKACERHFNPEYNYKLALDVYQKDQAKPVGRNGDVIRTLNDRLFAKRAATIVALLTINGRKDDANRYAEKAKTDLKNAEGGVIDQALAGVMPEQRP